MAMERFLADPLFDDWTRSGWESRPSQMFTQPLNALSQVMMPQTTQSALRFPLSVDIRESDNEFMFQCDIPGMTEKDIKIDCTKNDLTISGERQEEKSTEGRNLRRYERSFGSFRRQFAFPTSVRADDAHANYSAGVLTVTVPKEKQQVEGTTRVPIAIGTDSLESTTPRRRK
eukprot:Rmarinus@m.25081